MQLHHFRPRPTKEADGTLSAPDNPLACRICADLISKEGGSIARFADTAFLLGHRERQRLGQECPDFSEHPSSILLATDKPNHEALRVAPVPKSLIYHVHPPPLLQAHLLWQNGLDVGPSVPYRI